jgi:Zn-dependent peptidase ImmA (M78 family)
LFCRRTAVDEQPPPEPNVVDIEEEASRFAAALLMPQWLMIREHARVGGDLDQLITTFRTSGVAMTRRVADLFGA